MHAFRRIRFASHTLLGTLRLLASAHAIDGDKVERDYLSGRATVTDPAIIEARCSVAGAVECNIRDLVFLKQAMDAAATSVETRCDAALSPANAP